MQFNKWIKVGEGEVICDKCDGAGYRDKPQLRGIVRSDECPKCEGQGKLDWIDNAMGKKKSARDALPTQAATKQYVDSLTQGINWHNADSPPNTPSKGDAFYNTSDDIMYVFDDNSWVKMVST